MAVTLLSGNYINTGSGRWYKGNTHSHTHNSDGDASPEDVTKWYQGNGYNFLVLSDHNHFTDIHSFPWEKRDDFILIPGLELTSAFIDPADSGRYAIHVHAMNVNENIECFFGNNSALETVQENINRVVRKKGLSCVNHPNFIWAINHKDLLQIRDCRHIEIYNGHPATHNNGGGGIPGMEEVWDLLLSEGLEMYGIAADDAHGYNEFHRDLANPGRGWIHVKAEELTPRAVTEAVSGGNFYSSTGVELNDIQVNERELRIIIKQRKALYDNHAPAHNNFLYTTTFYGINGRELAKSPSLEPVYEFRGDEEYVRAKVVDSMGWAAWVQPVRIK
jgi:hypothetical protein